MIPSKLPEPTFNEHILWQEVPNAVIQLQSDQRTLLLPLH